jgi:hypothetical protein
VPIISTTARAICHHGGVSVKIRASIRIGEKNGTSDNTTLFVLDGFCMTPFE